MMFWYGGGWSFWQVVLMWVLMLGFWGLLAWAVYALVTSTTRRRENGKPVGARAILDARLARGEIDADEYRRLRQLLGAEPGSQPGERGTGA